MGLDFAPGAGTASTSTRRQGNDQHQEDDMMNLQPLTNDQLREAYTAAHLLLSLPARLDSELRIKLDTFRADVGAVIEDRGAADLDTLRAVKAAAE
jgi:hypothetical protein